MPGATVHVPFEVTILVLKPQHNFCMVQSIITFETESTRYLISATGTHFFISLCVILINVCNVTYQQSNIGICLYHTYIPVLHEPPC